MKRARETVRTYAEEARAQLAPLPDGLAAARDGVALRLHRRPHELTAARTGRCAGRPAGWVRPPRCACAAAACGCRRTIRPRPPHSIATRRDRPHGRVAGRRGQRAQAQRADAAARVHPGLGDRRGRGRRLRVQPDHREVHQARPGPAQAEAEHHADHQRAVPARRAAPARPRRRPACPAMTPTWRPAAGRPASRRPPGRRRRPRCPASGPARPGRGRGRAPPPSRPGTCRARSPRRRPGSPPTPITTSARGGPLAAACAGPAALVALRPAPGGSAAAAASRRAARTPSASPAVSATTGTAAPASSVLTGMAACFTPNDRPCRRGGHVPGQAGVAGQLAERVRAPRRGARIAIEAPQ